MTTPARTVSIRRGDFTGCSANLVVVIDVLRAFTTTHVLMRRGVSKIRLAGDLAGALELRRDGFIVLGERDGYALEGLDGGNSPVQAGELPVDDAPVALLTTHGVPAARAAARLAPRVYATGFSAAKETAMFVKRLPDIATVELWTSDPRGLDDLACAEYMRAIILGRTPVESGPYAKRIEESPTAAKFRDPGLAEFSRADLDAALRETRSDFVMRVVVDGDTTWLQRSNI